VQLFCDEVVAINAGDLNGWRSLLSHDFVMIDHRRVGFGDADVEGLMDIGRSAIPLVKYQAMRVREVVRVERWGLVVQTALEGAARDGGHFEIPYLVAQLSRDRLITRVELFEPADVAEATACLERRGPTPGPAPSARSPEDVGG
jgi:hypothetical protein